MRIGFLLLVLLACSAAVPFGLRAQIGIGILDPDSSAILHLEDTARGLLLPRLTDTQRDSIRNPHPGLVIYNTSDSTVQYWTGQCWLRTFQTSCGDCFFELDLPDDRDTLDRALSDSIAVPINLAQNLGRGQNIALLVANDLPNGLTVSWRNNPVDSAGQAVLVLRATPYAPAGTYPVVIQALCGPSVRSVVYSLTLTPCYRVPVSNSLQHYRLDSALYAQHPGAPRNRPVCVVNEVNAGVTLSGADAAEATWRTGALPANSRVALVNAGSIFGKGGAGGVGTDPILGIDGAGEDGGHAILLDSPNPLFFTLDNRGHIYGGGGGGAAMAFSINQPLGPVNLGIFIGAGGGGGAGTDLGPGGRLPNNLIGLTFYNPGQDATSGIRAQPGKGGVLDFPISFPLGPVKVDINPNAAGGDGGAPGFPGRQGVFDLRLSAILVVSVPFVGDVEIPIVQNAAIPIPTPAPSGGEAGFAVKRNASPVLNIRDNIYNTSFLKGEVGP